MQYEIFKCYELRSIQVTKKTRPPARKGKAKPVRRPAVLPENWRELPTLTINQARLLLGLSLNGAYEAAKRKEIPAVRFGNLWRVSVPQLRRMIDGEAA